MNNGNNGDGSMDEAIADRQSLAWQGFVYVSDTGINLPSPAERQLEDGSEQSRTSKRARVMPLSTVQVGDRVRIVSLNCGESNNRLMAMGLIPGAVLEVISSIATGSVIVSRQDHRLGLGTEMARRIQVIDADQPIDGHQLVNPQLASPQSTATAISQTMQPPSDIVSAKLRDAAIGSVLQVIGYEPTARDYKRKLLAMGLTPGTELCITRHAPLGDPTEIEVRGFHLSLRKDEADALIVMPIGGEKS